MASPDAPARRLKALGVWELADCYEDAPIIVDRYFHAAARPGETHGFSMVRLEAVQAPAYADLVNYYIDAFLGSRLTKLRHQP